jgi:hypothetical protein
VSNLSNDAGTTPPSFKAKRKRQEKKDYDFVPPRQTGRETGRRKNQLFLFSPAAYLCHKKILLLIK